MLPAAIPKQRDPIARTGVTAMMRLLQSAAIACATLMLSATALAQDSPAVGAAAPAFSLQDQTGKWHSLKDYRGQWVVLYFYPKDGTPGCTTQACEFRDNIFAYRKLNAVILGVSVDDVESHKTFSEEQNLPFPILADSDKKVTKEYGTLKLYMGTLEMARRDTFIIDPEGRVAKHYVSVDPKGHSELVLTDLKQLAAKATTAKAN